MKSVLIDVKVSTLCVTPLVGVWIEIQFIYILLFARTQSLPLWECGLKSLMIVPKRVSYFVTPLVGVWIEIFRVVSK